MASQRIEEQGFATSHSVSRSPAILHSSDHSRECHLTRRGFCNGLLVASAALVVAENGSASKATSRGRASLPDPPMRFEGAEALMPGSWSLLIYRRISDLTFIV